MNIKESVKEYKKSLFFGAVIILVLIPIVVYFLSVIPIFPSGENDWAGFWGGYIGSLLGGILTFVVMYDGKKNLSETLDLERKKQKRQENIDICNKCIELLATLNEKIQYMIVNAYEYNFNNVDKINFKHQYEKALSEYVGIFRMIELYLDINGISSNELLAVLYEVRTELNILVLEKSYIKSDQKKISRSLESFENELLKVLRSLSED